MRRFLTLAVLVPLTFVVGIFAIANRAMVTVSFDPFDSSHPALSFSLPLFVLIFVLVGLGVLVGGVAAWFRQHKWRMRARRAEAEARELRVQLDTGRAVKNVPAAMETPPPFAVPPAA
jgi:uncharacterized integral membrane protein